jgi:hypothetical protein
MEPDGKITILREHTVRMNETARNKRPFAKLYDVVPCKESDGDRLAIDWDGS